MALLYKWTLRDSESYELSREFTASTQQRNASLVSVVAQHMHSPGRIFVIAGKLHIADKDYSALEAIQKQWPDAKIAAICFKDASKWEI